MKKVLITIPWFDPAFRAGGPIQSVVNLLHQYKGEVTFFVFCGDEDLNGEALAVEKNTWLAYNDHTKVWYAASKSRNKHLQKQLKQINPDVLFCIGLYSWTFTLLPIWKATARKKIISVRGMLHPGALSQKWAKKRLFLNILKKWNLVDKVQFHATDKDELSHIKKQFGDKAQVIVAGNYPAKTNRLPVAHKERNQLNLCSIALISAMKNHLLVIQALQQVNLPVAYHIYGPIKDQMYWSECMKAISKLPVHIAVHYHGAIPPDQIPEILEMANVFILPSKSENFGHALFNALAAGKPVITSRFTPWNGLEDAKAGMNCDQTVDSIVSAIIFFASMNQETYTIWSQSASEYAQHHLRQKELELDYQTLFEQ